MCRSLYLLLGFILAIMDMMMMWHACGRHQERPMIDAALKNDCKHLLLSIDDVCCSLIPSADRANGTRLCNFDTAMDVSCPSRVWAHEVFLINVTRVTNQSSLSMHDFIQVGLRGVSLILCIRVSFRQLGISTASFTFECMVNDPGLYSVHANLIYEGHDGLDYTKSATASTYRRHRANVLSVPRSIEVQPLPNSSSDSTLPSEKCLSNRKVHRGRCLQHRHVCAQQHPLCSVPPSGSGWQYVPYECYYEKQRRLQHLFQNRTIVFTGDSTMRFLWGQLVNLLIPLRVHQFSQVDYGEMRNEQLYVHSNDGDYKHSFDQCDRFKISEYRSTKHMIRLVYYQVQAFGTGRPSPCEQLDLSAFTKWFKSVAHVDVLLINKHYLAKFGCTSDEQQKSDNALLYRYNHVVESISRHVVYRSMLAWHDSSLGEHCASLQLVHGHHLLKMQLHAQDDQYLDLFSMTHSLTFFEPTDKVHLTYQDNAMLAHILVAVLASYL